MFLAQKVTKLSKMRVFQLACLTALLSAIGARAMTLKYGVLDPDVWWHMRTGSWILQHGVPHAGLFSRTAAGRPWVAYSWGYEVLISKLFELFGLLGIALFGVAITVAVGAGLFVCLKALSGRFWLSWGVTLVAVNGFLFDIMPRPVFASMILFVVMLTALLRAQAKQNVTEFWIPLLFIVWANVHIQFVYGLLVLGLFTAVHVLLGVVRRFSIKLRFVDTEHVLPPSRLLLLLALSVLASCVGPYSYKLFQVVAEYSKAKVTYSMVLELLAPNFTLASNYVELGLAAAAFCALGWSRKLDLFKLALLVVAVVLAFRTLRDAWFLCSVSALCIAESFRTDPQPRSTDTLRVRMGEVAAVVLGLAFVLGLVANNSNFNTRGLDQAVSGFYPVDAANFIRRNPLPGPMFNSFDWGGFLIWYLPQYPVSLDGRNDLYGDELDRRIYGVESGALPYSQEPVLLESGFMLLRTDAPLAEYLASDPKYQAIYRDKIAVIYISR